eukprot:TRINITY_DN9112_c0_g1_i5.p1 TRINITY_DN9112_c0_g1~~TRINITY_DN9112_c0_g1_i5.p1  ORF type:complete len:132 (+),score=32.16 TRINITY_DN9112_c0_g1_i5:182-577(+)
MCIRDRACTKAERDPTCYAALTKHFDGGATDIPREQVVERLQHARGELWAAHANCKEYFADPAPLSKCGGEVQAGRTIARADVFCEAVTWQWEQLGDGDPGEFKQNDCPIPTTPLNDGSHRKGQSLHADEL